MCFLSRKQCLTGSIRKITVLRVKGFKTKDFGAQLFQDARNVKLNCLNVKQILFIFNLFAVYSLCLKSKYQFPCCQAMCFQYFSKNNAFLLPFLTYVLQYLKEQVREDRKIYSLPLSRRTLNQRKQFLCPAANILLSINQIKHAK